MTLFGAKYSSLWGAVLCFAECLAASLDLLSRWRRPPPSPVINNSTVSTHSVLWETRFPLAKNRLSGRKELQRKKKKKKKGKWGGKSGCPRCPWKQHLLCLQQKGRRLLCDRGRVGQVNRAPWWNTSKTTASRVAASCWADRLKLEKYFCYFWQLLWPILPLGWGDWETLKFEWKDDVNE